MSPLWKVQLESPGAFPTEIAAWTPYTVAMTIEADSREDATKVAHKLLDGIGATRIKITKHGGKYAKTATPVGDDAR